MAAIERESYQSVSTHH